MFDFLTEISGSEIIAAFISAALPLVVIVLFTLLAVYMERKISAHIQDRLGPMRVGWHGSLQLIADFIKLLQKEDIVAKETDKRFFNFAPFLVFMGTYGVYAALPFSSKYIGTELDLGIFYIIAISGLVVAGILMAGWSSNNKYSLYGALRSAAQIVSYEIPTALVILSIVMLTGTSGTGIYSAVRNGV
jgi:NADH-quinone oxidoreductase subunit H